MVGISWAGNPIGKVGESKKIGHCQFHVWGKKGGTSSRDARAHGEMERGGAACSIPKD